jgi:hypothetical protein
MNPHPHLLFHEVQGFRQTWVWVLLISLALVFTLVFGHGMVKQLVYGQPWGNRPMSDTALAIIGPLVILFVLGLAVLFLTMRMVTEVTVEGIQIRFFPLTRQKIEIHDIQRWEVRTYRPIREYGGWGIRYGRKGKAFNVSGNRGVQLELANGKRLLIGSQNPEALAKAIEQLKS